MRRDKGRSLDSESNRVTWWQWGVRFATIFMNFLLTQLVGSIIDHQITNRLCPLLEQLARCDRGATHRDYTGSI